MRERKVIPMVKHFLWAYSRLMGNALTAAGLIGLMAVIIKALGAYGRWAEKEMEK